MKQMSSLKQFTKEELCSLLSACSESLALAYQDSLQSDFLGIAMQARLACEALKFEIDSQNKAYSIH